MYLSQPSEPQLQVCGHHHTGGLAVECAVCKPPVASAGHCPFTDRIPGPWNSFITLVILIIYMVTNILEAEEVLRQMWGSC